MPEGGDALKSTRFAGGLCPDLTASPHLPAYALRGRRDGETLRRGLPNKETAQKRKAKTPKGKKPSCRF
jgi:hypothetical protein